MIAKHRKSNRSYAIRKVDTDRMVWHDRDALDDEIGALEALRSHSGVIRLFEIYIGPSEAYMVLERMRGAQHILDFMVAKPRYTELDVCNTCRALLSVAHHMHSKGIAHRNIKPANILVPVSRTCALLWFVVLQKRGRGRTREKGSRYNFFHHQLYTPSPDPFQYVFLIILLLVLFRSGEGHRQD